MKVAKLPFNVFRLVVTGFQAVDIVNNSVDNLLLRDFSLGRNLWIVEKGFQPDVACHMKAKDRLS